MASFPNSIFAPTTKNTGDTIQASHVNDVQDEIIAIEQGYRQATAPLNSSGSTMTSLSVTGGSTLASVSVTGGSTFGTVVAGASTLASLSVSGGSTLASLNVTGTISINGADITQWPRGKFTLSSAALTIANNTWTGLNWDTEVYDTANLHSTSANSSRVALTSSGLWLVGMQTVWTIGTNPSTLSVAVRIRLDDGEAIGGQNMVVSNLMNTLNPTLQACVPYYASDTTHYVTAQVWQDAGADMTLNGSTGAGQGPTQFWAQKVSN